MSGPPLPTPLPLAGPSHAATARAARPGRTLACRLGIAFPYLLFAWTWLWLAADLAPRLDGALAAGLALGAALLAWLAADLISGVAHWACDRFLEESTPVLGPFLIQPFREHHRDPLAITRRSAASANLSNCVVVLPALAACLAWTRVVDPGDMAAIPVGTFVLVLTGALLATNQIHRWAHVSAPPRAVRALQRAGLILSPAHHARHHEGGTAYCVTAGWCDAPLERWRVLERVEAWLRRETARPHGS